MIGLISEFCKKFISEVENSSASISAYEMSSTKADMKNIKPKDRNAVKRIEKISHTNQKADLKKLNKKINEINYPGWYNGK